MPPSRIPGAAKKTQRSVNRPCLGEKKLKKVRTATAKNRMPKTSNRKSAEMSNHGVAGRRLVDDRRDRPREDEREEREREEPAREFLARDDRERVGDPLLVLLELLDGARLTVLRLAIAQMFSSPEPIIPQRRQNGQPGRRATCVW